VRWDAAEVLDATDRQKVADAMPKCQTDTAEPGERFGGMNMQMAVSKTSETAKIAD